jgi:glycosyltransferase involved in cell wall biosynthesis
MFDNKVSIIIPSYNRSHLIGETLDSVLAQTYTNWECIIIDDGSTDATEELIANYIKKDSRFQYYHRPKDRLKGANACRNYGYEISNGNYIKWFDSDDIMYPDFLEKQVILLEEKKELDFCVCLADGFSDNDKKKDVYKANRLPKSDKLTAYMVKNHYFFTASPLWRSSILKDKILFDEDLSDSQETDFHFRMLSYDVKYLYTEDVLFSIRRGHSSITQDKINEVSSYFSRFKFFLKAFDIVENNEVDDKNLLKQYILYRQLGLYYYLKINHNKRSMTKYYIIILRNILKTRYSTIKKGSLIIGFLISIMTNKGFNFFKNAKVEIIEVIEN